jgi:TolB-like protein
MGLGLADSVITSLSDLPSLQVRPTSAVERFATERVDPLAAGRALGVETILTGQVVPVAGGSEVRLRLQNVRTGESRWEETLRVEAGGSFLTLQRRVVEVVRRRVTPAAPGGKVERA